MDITFTIQYALVRSFKRSISPTGSLNMLVYTHQNHETKSTAFSQGSRWCIRFKHFFAVHLPWGTQLHVELAQHEGVLYQLIKHVINVFHGSMMLAAWFGARWGFGRPPATRRQLPTAALFFFANPVAPTPPCALAPALPPSQAHIQFVCFFGS